MLPSQRLHLHRDAIREIARRHGAGGVFVFGSVVSGQDREDSDLDLLLQTTPSTTLLDLGAIQYEVSELIGIPVDVITPGALPESFRQQVLRSAQSV